MDSTAGSSLVNCELQVTLSLIYRTAACTTYACGSRNDDYAWRIPLAVQWR